jgi:hypothetical protein
VALLFSRYYPETRYQVQKQQPIPVRAA